ncbi:MAG: (d)CMP kinase [Firmicutes bacterium]|nr:(d)CMP kinase [Bacillota bacterium]
MNTDKIFHIAIDGPVASGKGVLAKALAARLGIAALDTGAMYRAIGLFLLESAIAEEDFADAVASVNFHAEIKEGETRVYINFADVTGRIRTREVAQMASIIYPIASERVTAMIREIAKGESLVLEGREISSHVLPEAAFKFYLTAKTKIRAQRRIDQYPEQQISLREMIKQVKIRDKRDRTRKVAPLRKVKGAIVIDNSKLSAEETVEVFYRHIKA